ncbi:AlpA family transcriptional regulator [Variovorax sp. dw_308]|uniref:helix-turn-helix transcriptional regulator n=1 Tax=Variovorax sp. dw_308 TaxID=2721546 RepID=UPI001C456CB1|nr:hypothetical protein [Variovorax sp. dw_308]
MATTNTCHTTVESERLLRLAGVLTEFPVSRSTWWKGVKEGRYPAPVRESGMTFWKKSDLQALIKSLGST